VERIFSSRPSSLASACAPSVPTFAQGHLGHTAVETLLIQTAPISGLGAISKINNTEPNNYMGATSAYGNGVATPITQDQKVSVRIIGGTVQTVQVDKVKGGNARGIPPRGKPV
jgi:hypothetical protein